MSYEATTWIHDDRTWTADPFRVIRVSDGWEIEKRVGSKAEGLGWFALGNRSTLSQAIDFVELAINQRRVLS